MAIFHATLKTITRSSGQSAVGAAAYRGALRLTDLTGQTFDYRRKKGVLGVDILAPSNAPAWVNDPAKLWRAAEAADVRVNSRTARELLVALPAELSGDQRAVLARDIGQMLVDRYRLAVMVAVHAPDKKGDQRNHHTHLLMTTRAITPDGFGGKVRILDDRKTGPIEVESIRARIAEITNQHLEQAGIRARVDHQTLAVQSKAAERRGDIVSAVLLAREPTRREDRVTIEARRRGEHPAGSAWNDSVRTSNAKALDAFLAAAQAQGRLIDTPVRSGTDQAKADRVREATNETNETNETRANVRRPKLAGQRSRGGSPSSKTVRHKISVSAGRGTRAEGKDANVLNAQATQASDTRRVERDMAQRYIDMLQALIEEHGQRAADAVAYARIHAWPIVDARALVQHRVRDPRCGALLCRGIAADAQWRRAQALGARRRDRYGTAMVATAQERRNLDQTDKADQPPAWKPRSRRAWAELRRQQRARLGQAQRRERRAQALVSDQAMAHYAVKVRTARDTLDQIERKRAAQYPVPRDVRHVFRRATGQHDGLDPSVALVPAPLLVHTDDASLTRARAGRQPGRR